ncbi:DUF115 domain-containing protein [bacterium]|nr:DUF115 domain-containing protein [bacterium]
MMVDFYLENIKYLPPDLLEKLPSVNPRYFLEKSKSGLPILTITNKEGRIISLHSNYNPQKEATRFISSFNLAGKNTVLVLGFALGYHIKELLKQPQINKIIVIDPDVEVFKLALTSQDLSNLLSSPKIKLIINEENFSNLYQDLSQFISLDNLNKVQIIRYLPCLSLDPDYYLQVDKIIKNILEMNVSNLAIFASFGKIWLENIFQNFFEIVNNAPVDSLFNKFCGLPAIIISAGPSLNKNLRYLKQAKGKAVLICVDTALKVLLEERIQPDIVVSVDPQPANFRHFERVDTHDLILLAEATVYHQILKTFQGRKFITCDESSIMDWLFNYLHLPSLNSNKISPLRGGGSVATVAFDFAKKIGADPIIFVGQDFSFLPGRIYASGTSYQEEWLNSLSKFNTLEMQYQEYVLSKGLISRKDIYGNSVLTSKILASYCDWLQWEIAQSNNICINATEGGILSQGISLIPLKEALEKYARQTIKIEEKLNEAQGCLPVLDKEKLMVDIESLMEEGLRLEGLCLEGLNLIEEEINEERITKLNLQIESLKITSLLLDAIRDASWFLSSKSNLSKECLKNLYQEIRKTNQHLINHLKNISSKLKLT